MSPFNTNAIDIHNLLIFKGKYICIFFSRFAEMPIFIAFQINPQVLPTKLSTARVEKFAAMNVFYTNHNTNKHTLFTQFITTSMLTVCGLFDCIGNDLSP